MPTTEANLKDWLAIECGMISTWPALTTVVDGSWVMRTAQGYSERANSVTVLDPQDGAQADQRLDAAEAFFRRENLRPVVRVTPLTPPSLIEELGRRDYEQGEETDILIGPLPDTVWGGPENVELNVRHRVDMRFVDTLLRASPRSDANPALVRSVLSVAGVESRFIVATVGETPVAVALAAVHSGWLTFHAVATAIEYRGNGIARAIMNAGIEFGRKLGAVGLWVGVVGDNRPAQSLYRSHGLKQAYAYHYRRGAP